MALSEEAKQIARELGLPEELPPRSNKPLTEEDWAKIEAKLRVYLQDTLWDEDLEGEDTMEDLDEETRRLIEQIPEF